MRKDIMSVLDLFREKGYACGYLTTNGTIITEERAEALAELAATGFLKHISVSVDGPKELHDAARGLKGTFERTTAGLRRLQEAARRKGAPLRVSINTTVAHESLDALDQMVDVAEELGVDAIGLNHLMFSTPEEVAETVRIIGAPDASVDRHVRHARSRARRRAGARRRSPRSSAKCRERNILFDFRPEGAHAADGQLLHAGHEARGPLPLSVPARARVVLRQGVFLPVHPGRGRRPARSRRSKRSGTASATSRCARRLLEHGIFPVCRRCCKVELSPVPARRARPDIPRRRRAIPLTVVRLTCMLGRKTLLVNPPLVNGVAFTRQGRCQEREEVLGTTKPPYTLALHRRRCCATPAARCGSSISTAERRPVDQTRSRGSMRESFVPTLILFPSTTPTLDADVAADGAAQGALRRADVLLRPARLDHAAGVDARARRTSTACSSASRKTRRCSSRASTALDQLADDPEPHLATPRAGRRRSSRTRAHGIVHRASCTMPYPAWDLVAARVLLAAARQPAVRDRRDEPRLSRTRATSASRRSTRGTSSASAARRRWSTRSSAATASSASTSSICGATRSR